MPPYRADTRVRLRIRKRFNSLLLVYCSWLLHRLWSGAERFKNNDRNHAQGDQSDDVYPGSFRSHQTKLFVMQSILSCQRYYASSLLLTELERYSRRKDKNGTQRHEGCGSEARHRGVESVLQRAHGYDSGHDCTKSEQPFKTIHNSPLLHQCLGRESNPYAPCGAPDFKSGASASSATQAN